MFGQGKEREREAGEVIFHPMRKEEYNLPSNMGLRISPKRLALAHNTRNSWCCWMRGF